MSPKIFPEMTRQKVNWFSVLWQFFFFYVNIKYLKKWQKVTSEPVNIFLKNLISNRCLRLTHTDVLCDDWPKYLPKQKSKGISVTSVTKAHIQWGLQTKGEWPGRAHNRDRDGRRSWRRTGAGRTHGHNDTDRCTEATQIQAWSLSI